MNPLISICVPVYNVAPYIERCVRSLMEQRYEALEFIFIDDCSTDSSIAILKRTIAAYPTRLEQVHIYSNGCNKGLAYSRRESIIHATGQYIVCVDADDWIDGDMVAELYQKMQDKNADITTCVYAKESTKQSKLIIQPSFEVEHSFEAALLDNIFFLAGKLIPRDYFKDERIFAPEGLNYLEDRYTIIRLMGKSPKVVTSPNAIYHYLIHEGSVSQGKQAYHIKCLIRYWQKTEEWLRDQNLYEPYAALIGYKKADDIISLLLYVHDNAIRRQYADVFSEEQQRYAKQLTRGKRFMAFLIRHRLYVLMRLLDFINYLREK